mgnify:CR=1 FL=1
MSYFYKQWELIWRDFKDLTLNDEDPVGHHDAHNSRTIQPSNKEPML